MKECGERLENGMCGAIGAFEKGDLPCECPCGREKCECGNGGGK